MLTILNLDLSKPITFLNKSYKGLTTKEEVQSSYQKQAEVKETLQKEETNENPTIYLYNTHQTENYKATSFLEYSISPNVMMSSFILKEQLMKKGYQVIVEEEDIATVRKSLGLNYAGSYKASRTLMEKAKNTYPSLTYFIDLHRDSVLYDKTTLQVDDVTYAKILFIVGLENPNYQANLELTNKINNLLEEKIKGISRGIYKKSGDGVDGVYNQDFSPNTILVEMGGPDNTIDEVYRSTILLAEVLDEVMKND